MFTVVGEGPTYGDHIFLPKYLKYIPNNFSTHLNHYVGNIYVPVNLMNKIIWRFIDTSQPKLLKT